MFSAVDSLAIKSSQLPLPSRRNTCSPDHLIPNIDHEASDRFVRIGSQLQDGTSMGQIHRRQEMLDNVKGFTSE